MAHPRARTTRGCLRRHYSPSSRLYAELGVPRDPGEYSIAGKEDGLSVKSALGNMCIRSRDVETLPPQARSKLTHADPVIQGCLVKWEFLHQVSDGCLLRWPSPPAYQLCHDNWWQHHESLGQSIFETTDWSASEEIDPH